MRSQSSSDSVGSWQESRNFEPGLVLSTCSRRCKICTCNAVAAQLHQHAKVVVRQRFFSLTNRGDSRDRARGSRDSRDPPRRRSPSPRNRGADRGDGDRTRRSRSKDAGARDGRADGESGGDARSNRSSGKDESKSDAQKRQQEGEVDVKDGDSGLPPAKRRKGGDRDEDSEVAKDEKDEKASFFSLV